MMFKVPGKKQTQNQKNNSKTTNKLNPTKLPLKKNNLLKAKYFAKLVCFGETFKAAYLEG